ncbi:MAG: terminase small subunit [Rhodospirillales bacterium]|nr:terminase small subunit [Rhodospirillales bacterium]
MKSDTYRRDDDEEWRRRARDSDAAYYSLYKPPTPSEREPWMTDDEWAGMPGRQSGESLAAWLDRCRGYVDGLRAQRRIAAARLPTSGRGGDAAADAGSAPPKPLRRRHELFCQYFVLYGNAARAAGEAGYAPESCKNQGYRLLKRPEVKARIAEIHRELAGDFNPDGEVLLGKLEAVYRRAVDDGYLNAAARIVELQARLTGLPIGRRQAARPAPYDDL